MPTTAAVGAKLTATIWNNDVEAELAAWTAWTPVWSSSGTAVALGNGTAVGRYMQDGKSVTAKFTITAGTTTTYGTGNYAFTFPVAAHASYVIEDAMGFCSVRRSTRVSGTLIWASSTTALVSLGNGGTLSQTVPGSWASGDILCAGVFVYESS